MSTDPYIVGLRLLAGRELSRQRVTERLARRGFSADAIADAVERLSRTGALDDWRAARSFARTLAGRGRGRLRVRRDVEARGIESDLARRAVDEAFAEIDDDQHLQTVLMSRAPSTAPDKRQLERLYRFLVRRGFPPSDIHRALRRLSRHWDAE